MIDGNEPHILGAHSGELGVRVDEITRRAIHVRRRGESPRDEIETGALDPMRSPGEAIPAHGPYSGELGFDLRLLGARGRGGHERRESLGFEKRLGDVKPRHRRRIGRNEGAGEWREEYEEGGGGDCGHATAHGTGPPWGEPFDSMSQAAVGVIGPVKQ
jgi:hypothetical protein